MPIKVISGRAASLWGPRRSEILHDWPSKFPAFYLVLVEHDKSSKFSSAEGTLQVIILKQIIEKIFTSDAHTRLCNSSCSFKTFTRCPAISCLSSTLFSERGGASTLYTGSYAWLECRFVLFTVLVIFVCIHESASTSSSAIWMRVCRAIRDNNRAKCTWQTSELDRGKLHELGSTARRWARGQSPTVSSLACLLHSACLPALPCPHRLFFSYPSLRKPKCHLSRGLHRSSLSVGCSLVLITNLPRQRMGRQMPRPNHRREQIRSSGWIETGNIRSFCCTYSLDDGLGRGTTKKVGEAPTSFTVCWHALLTVYSRNQFPSSTIWSARGGDLHHVYRYADAIQLQLWQHTHCNK